MGGGQQAPAAPQGNTMSFAQLAAEEGDDLSDLTARDLYLAQLAYTTSTLSPKDSARFDEMLAQLENSEDGAQEKQILAQTSEDDHVLSLVQQFVKLSDEELAQVTAMLEESDSQQSGEMSQVDNSEADSQRLAQLDSDIDSVNDEEMGELVAEFLAQIDEGQKQQL